LASALANEAVAARRGGSSVEAERLAELAAKETDNVALAMEKSTLLLSLGRTFQEMIGLDPTARERRLTRAGQLLQQALTSAQKSGAARPQSYALGYLGQLYAADGQPEAALRLSRAAVFAAQRADAPDALFQWEWDSARAQKALNRPDEAIASYRRAIATFQTVLHDWIMGVSNHERKGSFRDEVGPMYLELTDLLLRQSDGDPAQGQLEEARQTLELLKAGEYADYFRDSCVNTAPPKPVGIDALAPRTAVFYFVPLPDRTELLLGLSGKLQRFKTPVGSEELIQTVREFRKKLEKRTSREYLLTAQKLYDWLIRPALPALRDRLVDTIVFVPDGALRTVPPSALHDGEKFLVAEFAVAVAPGLSLMDPRPLKQVSREMLLSGLSEAVPSFPKLDYVPAELDQVRSLYGGKVLLNGDFVTSRAAREFSKANYSLVHIASHAQFSNDLRQTFLLTHDGRLTLNQLERAIRPCQYRGRPVELLALSACQTAAGDDRAALGLAGVALKAGARSALATLWCVNDQASAVLVAEFYTQLHQGNSKAAALRGAQLNLMGDQRYYHPAFWAPYLIIGNWL
jgi:CHAT domain-containing protein